MNPMICQNPECKKIYNSENHASDDGYCSFECWEQVHCLKPPVVQFEEINLVGAE